ncbi:MAG: apolipoprotein N-acyltransferase [Nitrospiraceae bacterium]|nr:apolipoprotein N-acyltransferase [Nitrospiraceae bacterium]
MRDSLAKKAGDYLPAVISGILVVLSFPVFDLYPLAWVAFVPFLLSLWGKTPKKAFLAGYVFGLVYFFGTLYWIYYSINHYGGVSFLSSLSIVVLLCLYLGLYPAVFSLLFVKMIRRTELPALVIAPVLWVALEFLRSYALTGFPWASIGYSQYRFLHMIQVADITGIYGISFLVLAVNGAAADLFLLRRRVSEMPLFPTSYTVVGFALLVLAAVAAFGYGQWRLSQERPGNTLRVSLVQGDIEQDEKWEPSYQGKVLDTYFDLSRRAAGSSPRLIVWPETALPFIFGADAARTEKLIGFEQGLGTDLLTGTILLRQQSAGRTLLSNSAILLDKEGKNVYEYDKIHLVPFGEYVPLRSVLFFVDKLVTGIGDYVPGKEYIRAETDFGSFATLICYEIIFPGLVRKFYTKGGDFILNITNDAWFGRTSGPYQHFGMAVFRAIENRKPVIRCANTGISGFIDSDGRVLARTRLFERVVLPGAVKTDETLSFYTKYGDLFSYLCIVISIVISLNIKMWR